MRFQYDEVLKKTEPAINLHFNSMQWHSRDGLKTTQRMNYKKNYLGIGIREGTLIWKQLGRNTVYELLDRDWKGNSYDTLRKNT